MIEVTMNDRLNVVWADVAGKMNDISRDQLPAYLTLCIDDLGSDIVVVDLRHASGQPDAMKLMAQRLAFPDYFGGNLDALFDVVSERVAVDVASQNSTPQTWLFKSLEAQKKMLFPIADTLRDAMSESTGVAVSVLWMTLS